MNNPTYCLGLSVAELKELKALLTLLEAKKEILSDLNLNEIGTILTKMIDSWMQLLEPQHE